MALSKNSASACVLMLLAAMLSGNRNCPSAMAEPPIVSKLTTWAKGQGKPPRLNEDRALEELAAHVDWLEQHLNQWGSVSAKAPDVWGEARLTQYRLEVEEQLKSRVAGFDEARLHGAQAVSDGAMLSAALALNARPTLPSGQTRVAAPEVSISVQASSSAAASGEPAIQLNHGFIPPGNTFGSSISSFVTNDKLQLEQTEVLNQLQRYLQHLNQIRRINEGDDTADAPGYSLNLVRLPISILPGTNSKQGYGAEITVTAKPYLGPDLLPTTFRDLAVNDLTDQLVIPLAKFLNSNPNRADRILSYVTQQRKQLSNQRADIEANFSASDPDGKRLATVEIEQASERAQKALVVELGDEFATVCAISLASSTSRRAQLPYPPTQLIDVLGIDAIGTIALSAWQAFRDDLPNKRVVHATDARTFLSEEIGAAVELLNADAMLSWWQREATGERYLYNLVRLNRSAEIAEYRDHFIQSVGATGRARLTPILAWALFVDSILLNERLLDDIRQTMGNRPCGCQCHSWLAFFGPQPSDEARYVFAEYVRCRWPVRVFALDPAIDQQAIADASSVYRQMQMAVVLAFAGGDIGISTALDTMRKLQRDRITIDLNRTAIAFGHGDDTFGWRFEPRFQTPPVESNAKVLLRDLIVGGPTDRQLERTAEIEAGMRECTAIVLMPSFVPFVTFETRGNWYKLTRPGHIGTSIQENVQASRAIKQMQACAQMCVRSHHLYRDGEIDRVMARVAQLERRLPLQTIACQVPIENTHGGFEILSDGTRELSPELIGWYGAPGYSRAQGGHFFLAGDSFSVKETRVIAGNRTLLPEEMKLLSRQLIEVKLPNNLSILTDTMLIQHDPGAMFDGNKDGYRNINHDVKYDGWVDVHLATPYGASGHLLIPVIHEELPNAASCPPAQPTTLSVDSVTIQGTLTINKNQDLTRLETATAMWPPILLPNGSEVGVTSRTLRLHIRMGNDALAPITLKEIPLTADRKGYQIPADVTLEMLSSKGELFKALKSYLPFAIARGHVDLSRAIEIPVTFTVEYEKIEVPVQGQLTLKFDIKRTESL